MECRVNLLTQQGIQCLSDDEAAVIAGKDLDHHRRDLYTAIAMGNFPKWRVAVQIMPEAAAEHYHLNPFDLTKVWPHKDYPLIDVGMLELNRNPDNYFAEVEQAAFEPSNLPPGMGVSPDKMLQGRLLSYPDAHRYRIGTNYAQLPVNRPRCPMQNYNRDGHMRFDGNAGNQVNYQPNSFEGPTDHAQFLEPPLRIFGHADRYDHRNHADDYSQAGALYRLMSEPQKQQLIDNLIRSLQPVPQTIQIRQAKHFYHADPEYGTRVAKGLGIRVEDIT